MGDLFIMDIIIGYVLPIKDEPCILPAVSLKLLNFPNLTVHCIPLSEQHELKKKFQNDTLSVVIGSRGSQNCVVFKKGKSCSFKLSKQEAQKLCLPLTVILSDNWYLPVKELARTRIDILVPHFKQGSVIAPVNSHKQVYELCDVNNSKVAMIELSYKLKRIHNQNDTVITHKPKPISNKENSSKMKEAPLRVPVSDKKYPSKKEEKSIHTNFKHLMCSNDTSVNASLDKLTICPPPLLYSANADDDQLRLQSEIQPVTDQDVSQVVWPNGYIHTEPKWNVSKEDAFDTVVLPSCPQFIVPPIADEAGISDNQNFQILRAFMKELSAMEQLLKSKGISRPVQNHSDVYVQTEMSNNHHDKSTSTEMVIKKSVRKKKRFTRECCATKSDPSPTRVKPTVPQNKITSTRIKIVHQKISPSSKANPSPLHESRPSKINMRSSQEKQKSQKQVKIIKPPAKQKSLPQVQVDSAVSRIPPVTQKTKSDNNPKGDKKSTEEFSVNTSIERTGDQSKLNLEIHLPTLTKVQSVTALSLNHGDGNTSTASNTDAVLVTEPADPVTPPVIPVTSAVLLAPASQSDRLTFASSNEVQSYADLSLSSEDPLNQSNITNVMFSTKHLEAALADKSSTHASPTIDNGKPNDDDATSPVTNSNESIQYEDDFESSNHSGNSEETLSSLTSEQ